MNVLLHPNIVQYAGKNTGCVKSGELIVIASVKFKRPVYSYSFSDVEYFLDYATESYEVTFYVFRKKLVGPYTLPLTREQCVRVHIDKNLFLQPQVRPFARLNGKQVLHIQVVLAAKTRSQYIAELLDRKNYEWTPYPTTLDHRDLGFYTFEGLPQTIQHQILIASLGDDA